MELGSPIASEVVEALAHLPVAVGIIDAHGVIRFVNRAAEQLYGWRGADVVGKSALALGVAPSETADAVDLIAKLRVGEIWRGRFPVLRSDGERRQAWMSVVALPLDDDPTGQPTDDPALLVVAVDAEDLQEDVAADQLVAESRAEDANLLVQGLLDAVPVGLAFFDRALRYVRVNDALAETNGIPAEAHVGQRITELLEGIPSEVADDIESVFTTGATIPQRLVVGETPAAPGVERQWLVSYYPIRRRDEVAWVGAVALEVTERAQLLASERAARQRAEESAERLARLQIVTGRLAEASDMEAVAHVVVRFAGAGVGADGGALCIVEGDALRVLEIAGMDPDATARFDSIPLDAPLPAADAVRRQEMVLLGSCDERDGRYPALAAVVSLNKAFAAIPMVVDGEAIGCITFGWIDERAFDDGESHFLLALGRQAAQALERTRLYEAERAARAEAEEAGERMRFLAEASRVLASSLDYEETLRDLAELAVPALGDLCLLHLLDGDDLRLMVAAHRNPAAAKKLEPIIDGPHRHRTPQLLGRALIAGDPIVLREVPDELLQRVSENEAQLATLRAMELRSGIIVPIRSQHGVLGVLTLGADASSGRSFDESDLPFVEDLAGRAAVAIENSRSHRARTEVAQTLQRSLLPPHLPDIAGLELAQRYQSVGDVEVGGDFYDVFPSGDGRWGVVMGDVCGKGVAAASLTALARYTVRAGAIEGEPAAVLRLLNRAILDSDAGERFCTIVHAMLEPGEGSARIVLSCGGHPLPLVLRSSGEVEAVGTPGSAIGLFEEVELSEVEVRLGPGDAIALYTDGFTEARSPDGAFDPDLLGRVLASAAGRTADEIAEAVTTAVLDFEGGEQRDDMALLVLRVRPSTA